MRACTPGLEVVQRRRATSRRASMNTRLAMKLDAVALALLVNSLVVGAAAYFSDAHNSGQPNDSSVACTENRAVHPHVEPVWHEAAPTCEHYIYTSDDHM